MKTFSVIPTVSPRTAELLKKFRSLGDKLFTLLDAARQNTVRQPQGSTPLAAPLALDGAQPSPLDISSVIQELRCVMDEMALPAREEGQSEADWMDACCQHIVSDAAANEWKCALEAHDTALTNSDTRAILQEARAERIRTNWMIRHMGRVEADAAHFAALIGEDAWSVLAAAHQRCRQQTSRSHQEVRDAFDRLRTTLSGVQPQKLSQTTETFSGALEAAMSEAYFARSEYEQQVALARKVMLGMERLAVLPLREQFHSEVGRLEGEKVKLKDFVVRVGEQQAVRMEKDTELGVFNTRTIAKVCGFSDTDQVGMYLKWLAEIGVISNKEPGEHWHLSANDACTAVAIIWQAQDSHSYARKKYSQWSNAQRNNKQSPVRAKISPK